jgi:hypothetical protein
MSRVTAAFVCALCDPDNPRPASIMCSNNCGRYVCAVHAVSRKGPGSAMVCQSCAEALGLADKPKPKPVPEVRPLIEIPSEPAPQPAPEAVQPTPVQAAPVEAAPAAKPAPAPEAAETAAKIAVISAAPPSGQATEVVVPLARVPETAAAGNVVPADQQSTARQLVEPETPPKSVASETVVSQRGNTLQVPKVTPGMGTPPLGKPPTPIGPSPRKAQRASEGAGGTLDWTLIGTVIGSVVLGIAGLVLILVAITP